MSILGWQDIDKIHMSTKSNPFPQCHKINPQPLNVHILENAVKEENADN